MEEADGISVPVAASPPVDDRDSSPVGSPDAADSDPRAPDELQPPHRVASLTDELREKIIKQVEYYFSDENLQTDKFLMKYLNKDKEGFVPIGVIASFRKMKKLTQDKSVVVVALRDSSLLVLSSDEKKVKRLHPFPISDFRDPELCTVLVENIPEDHSQENMQKIFGEAGNIKNVTIHKPNVAKEPRKFRYGEKLLSGKLHAVVEYETIEAAEKAVSLLNNEQDWRFGMRVKLLKQRVKHGQKKKGHEIEKSSNAQAFDPPGDESHHSSEHHDDTTNEVNEEHPMKERNGHKGGNRGRYGKQKNPAPNVLGHGNSHRSHAIETSKPPPGPTMPDGTRGFTMGRGRPLGSVRD